jgi:alginate O-acetyltransferase complex protein AlgI
MQFNSISYLVSLLTAVCLYWQLTPKLRRRFVFLASLAFYATWSVMFIAIPFVVCGIAYGAARLMVADPARTKRWMWMGVAATLTILAFFKYREFALANANAVLACMGARPLTWAAKIALPLGISFYTFEAVSYLIDVRQGRIQNPGFTDLCLFVMFWPHLMAGPIVRVRELVPQLKFDVQFEPAFVFSGVDRLLWGFLQKNVFANTLSIWIERGFSTHAPAHSSVDNWVLAIAFGLQIYFDFAAYSNMAIGAARLLGITLPENFRQPYHAATPPEFWSRWHMTLSRWIRDYLFFPINTKFRGSPGMLYMSLIAVMALVGLWHGAGWGFIVWGLMHGVLMALYRIYERYKDSRPGLAGSVIAAAGIRALTLMGITAAWVPFRAPSISKAASMFTSMFMDFSPGFAYSGMFYAFTAALVIFCAVEPRLVRMTEAIEKTAVTAKGMAISRVLARPVAYACAMLLFMIFDEHDAQFIYFQF